jgi:hypothetical protein
VSEFPNKTPPVSTVLTGGVLLLFVPVLTFDS